MNFLVVVSVLGIAGVAFYAMSQNADSAASSSPDTGSAGGGDTGAGGVTPSPATPPPQPQTQNMSGTYYNSDMSITGHPIGNSPETWPSVYITDKLWDICEAVASAEGYNRGSGTAPYDLNNPGDLSPGDEAGEQTCGAAEQHGGSAIIHFCTAEGGWRALYHKFSRIVAGQSAVYPQSWTWTQISQKYAGNSANWVANVIGFLGVSPDSTPAEYVNS